MSLEKKVQISLTAAFLNLASPGCTSQPYSINLGGVAISETVTDKLGKAYFNDQETGESVEVEVTISETDFPLVGATILYFDDSHSKAFSISHPAFSPQLNIALHNSNHRYSLTPAPLQILHDSSGKEQSKEGAEQFLSRARDWTNTGWENTGCLNRENMLTLIKPSVYALKIYGIIKTMGLSETRFDQGLEYLEENLPESAVADTYVFVPSKHGFGLSTTTITALDIKFNGECKYEDLGNNQTENNNDNTDNNQEESDNPYSPDSGDNSDCQGTIFCDTFSGSALDSSKWNIINDSGIKVYQGWLSLPSASSLASQNQFANSCPDKRVELRGAPYIGSVFLGKMGLSANQETAILSCGDHSKEVSIAGAENGVSLYKSGGLLSLLVNGTVNSIPCSEKMDYVQLTAGLNDLVKIDYVKVKCN